MADYQVKGKALTLYGNPEACTYSVDFDGNLWTMSERPFVLFSDDTKVVFPSPSKEREISSGTASGIEAVYTDFGDRKITVNFDTEEVEIEK